MENNFIKIIKNLLTFKFEQEWFEFKENFDNDYELGDKVGNKVGNKKQINLSSNRETIIKEIRNNPNITTYQLSLILKISETAVDKNLKYLKENQYIKRIGSRKTGYWEVKNED